MKTHHARPILLRLIVVAWALISLVTPAPARLAAWYQLDEAHSSAATAVETLGGGPASLIGYDANAQGTLLQEFAPALSSFRTDVSYGEVMTGPQVTPPVFAWFLQPTPRAANSTPSVAGLVADTSFSVKRGWKTQ